MVTTNANNMLRVTVTLDPEDVELLDRLAALEGLNRSAELRQILRSIRPTIRATVHAFEGAFKQRETLDHLVESVEFSKLQQLVPEAEKLQDTFMGVIARVEGLIAADAPASNTGATE